MKKNLRCVQHVSRQGQQGDIKLKSCDKHLPDDLPQWVMDEDACHTSDVDSDGSACSEVDYNSSSIELLNSHIGDTVTTTLTTYSRGVRLLFQACGKSVFCTTQISTRIMLPLVGPFTLITCTSLSNMSQGCNGRFVMFKPKGLNDDHWNFGVVASFEYLLMENEAVMHLFQWTGSLLPSGTPEFVQALSWDEMSKHFELMKFTAANTEVQFVNQVQGIPMHGGCINSRTRNKTDGGIQCAPEGPDIVPSAIEVPTVIKQSLSKTLLHNSLSAKSISHPDMYVIPKRGERREKIEDTFVDSRRLPRPLTEEQQLALEWGKSPKKALVGSHLQRVIVVTGPDQSNLACSVATHITKEEKKLYYMPAGITTDQDSHCPIMPFHGVSKAAYNTLTKTCQGISFEDYFERVSSLTSNTHHLVDCDSICPPPTDDSNNSFHDYTRIFAGSGSPDVDESFTAISVPDTQLTVHYKFTHANDFKSHVPLSVGLFHAKFHDVAITQSCVDLINRALGLSGLFDKRPRSGHHNSCSYIGKRSSKSCSQPSPSEGPNEKDYWYFRTHLSHFLWPFVLHLMMLLASRISLVAYYQYAHLSKLLPLAHDEPNRQNYCDIGIITLSYDSTLHVDNDRLDNLDKMFKRKLQLLTTSQYLKQYSQEAARRTLEHVNQWGVGSPTTCGYQYVGDESTTDVEIIQYFCCKGLGICYRIRNYWVHLFLAYCFAHYTSVAIFVKDETVYFGKYPKKAMVAWGKGRPLGSFTTIIDGNEVRRSRRLRST